MDENSAPKAHEDATPIFGAYRRGYDPDQVDRFVADQRRRLDEAVHRASEAERRLAAAVGQLRELHRRVTLLESEERAPQQAPSLDTLGERVQRILQEAWEGAFALRQTVEQEASELKERAHADADEIVAAARRKAEAIEEEIERRRRGYLERVEQDRARAVAQMTYLGDQRKLALKELLQIKARIETTVGDLEKGASRAERQSEERPAPAAQVPPEAESDSPDPGRVALAPAIRAQRVGEPDLPPTMPVHRLRLADDLSSPADTSALVVNHRSGMATRETALASEQLDEERDGAPRARASIFDFDEAQPS